MIIGALILVDRMGYCGWNDLVVLLMFFALFFSALGEKMKELSYKKQACFRERMLE